MVIENRPPGGIVAADPFDVLDEEGRYLGPVLAPPGTQSWSTPVLTRSHVWAVVLNMDFGHPQIVRYRIAPRDGE